MNRKRQIDEIIDSVQGMDPALPDEHVLDNILARIKTGKRKVEVIPLRTVSLAAACILLLVIANVYFVVQDKKVSVGSQEDAMQSVISYYGLNEETIPGI